MTLKVLLPFEVFAAETAVSRIVVDTVQGAFGLLPQRLDCIAAVVPGILSFTANGQGEVFMALDEGVLVKTGRDVVIAVRRALRGADLAGLRAAVEQQFLILNAEQQQMRVATAKLESGFMRRFASMVEHPS
ncbi:MAG: F0F1 ATP synthase subunit epsilon [Gammaproteobacteria bacterium]|nr:F0F1 ATP synthase subunit epsilon [Gammaproteobacteria bacterium]